jgi:hypothetical protein
MMRHQITLSGEYRWAILAALGLAIFLLHDRRLDAHRKGRAVKSRPSRFDADHPNTLCKATRHAKTSDTTPMKMRAP